MFYVYVIQSKKDKGLYIGLAVDSPSTNFLGGGGLKKRLEKHNKGLVASTKNRRPFRMVYYEAYSSRADAAEREQKLKQFKNSYTELKKRIKNSLLEI